VRFEVRTFENLAALRNIATLLGSFSVSGTDNPQLKLQAQMRYIAFTAQLCNVNTTHWHCRLLLSSVA